MGKDDRKHSDSHKRSDKKRRKDRKEKKEKKAKKKEKRRVKEKRRNKERSLATAAPQQEVNCAKEPPSGFILRGVQEQNLEPISAISGRLVARQSVSASCT